MMSANPVIDLDGEFSKLAQTALRIKRERDEMEAALRDIVLGAEMMLQPALNLQGAFLSYVREVKRVAEAPLS